MVGGRLVIRSVVCGWWLVGGRFLFLRMVSCWCLNQYMVGGRWLMVGGRWLVGGRWFCTTPFPRLDHSDLVFDLFIETRFLHLVAISSNFAILF